MARLKNESETLRAELEDIMTTLGGSVRIDIATVSARIETALAHYDIEDVLGPALQTITNIEAKRNAALGKLQTIYNILEGEGWKA